MKKFRFALETVLSYKQQILDSLQIEHAEILGQVRRQEELLDKLRQDYNAYGAEYRTRCAEGIPVTEALTYQAGLRAREREIRQETEKLDELRRQEEAKRSEVVESRKDTASIEKLREKQLNAYQTAISKSEEKLIEEFVASIRSTKTGEQAG